MGRHPIDDDANSRPMTAIDQSAEFRRPAVAAGRREQAERLIAPRVPEGIFGDRQKLEMGKSHLDQIGHKPLAHLGPS